MKRCRNALLFFVLVAAVASAVYFLTRPPNPSYQGKRLSQWLKELPETRNPSVPPQTVEAIQAMGETAIPFLLHELSFTDSKVNQKLNDLLQRFRINLFSRRPTLWRQEKAKAALIVMGSSAKTAIPKLEKFLEDEEIAGNAASVLLHLAPEGTTALKKAMSHPKADVRRAVAWSISTPDGTNYVRLFLPELLQQLNDPDHYVQNAAIRAVENIPEKPEIIIPALIKCLPINPMIVGEALERFGTNVFAYSNQIVKLILEGKLPVEWAPKLITNTVPVSSNTNAILDLFLKRYGTSQPAPSDPPK